MDERTYGVGELAGLFGRLLTQAFPGSLWVQGQIRNLSRSAAGHVYFDLAEPGPLGSAPAALIPVTLLAADRPGVNAIMRGAGAGRIQDGVEVRIAGRVNWYTPRGRLQLRMVGIDPTHTLGRLLEDRDRLLAVLRADGLLDRNRARAVPDLALRVGLITSLGSAAHADFLHEIERSGLPFTVIEVDARTQGLDAGWSVSAAIGALSALTVDVVAIVRGGGSRTDLAPFDGEAIARAIAGCPTPVFTGIGHETDRSIADEVAHTAAKTPTACASTLVERAARAFDRAEHTWSAVQRTALARLDDADARVRQAGQRAARAGWTGLDAGDRRLDEATRRLRGGAERALVTADGRLAVANAQVRALDPAAALARGWSITRGVDGRAIRSASDVSPGDVLVTTLAMGTVTSTVTGAEPPPDHPPTDQPETSPDA